MNKALFPFILVALCSLSCGGGSGSANSTTSSQVLPIARWNVVPYQTIQGSFKVGIVAFHAEGIQRISLKINGEERVLSEASKNDRTETWEYWTAIDAQSLPDGEVQLEAEVFPNSGTSRKLDPILLYSNAKNTLEYSELNVSSLGSDLTGTGNVDLPFATINRALDHLIDEGHQKGSAKIILSTGHYAFPSGQRSLSLDGFLTLEATEGEDVLLEGGGLWQLDQSIRLECRNISMSSDSGGALFIASGQQENILWINYCTVFGQEREHEIILESGFDRYITHSLFKDQVHGPIKSRLIRNTEVQNIRSDAFSFSEMVINCKVEGIDATGTTFHPDVYQIFSPNENVDNRILFGIEAYRCHAQGLLLKGALDQISNIAIVNFVMQAGEESVFKSQIDDDIVHLLFLHNSFIDQELLFRQASFKELHLKNNLIYGILSEQDSLNQLVNADQNHFISLDQGRIEIGTSTSSGDPGFKSSESYQPAVGSILNERIQDLFIGVDVLGQPLNVPASLGAIQP